jgi:predicted CXXCH cytochrome family protein
MHRSADSPDSVVTLPLANGFNAFFSAFRCCLTALAGLALLLPLTSTAGSDCNGSGVWHAPEAAGRDMGPRHHPIGKPLPDTGSFGTPDRCLDGVWFFDRNHNGRLDDDELRLFGPQRVVDCASCHGESSGTKSKQSESVFLRQDASTLCLVCHKL